MFSDAAKGLPTEPKSVPKSVYLDRQQRFLSQLKPSDLVIITTPSEAVRSNDVTYPYRTSSDMLYLVGWADPESALIFHHNGSQWISHLFVQPKDTLKEIWEGRRPGAEGAKLGWSIDEATSIHDLEEHLDMFLSDCSTVHVRTGISSTIDLIVLTSIERRDRNRQHFGSGPVSLEDPSRRIAEMRLRKSPEEIELMRHAAEISSVAHELAMRASKDGIFEYQLQSIIEGFFVYGGTSGWAYPSIVGCGENATILHYTVNESKCKGDEIILIDAGAEYKGYAADITRSWPIGGTFTDAQKEIYEIVLDAQEQAIAACRVGNPYNQPHEVARSVLAEGLIRLGIINQSLEEALDSQSGQLKNWYMHNTGHWLGLDVHDVGVYKPDGTPRLLEAGMVLTVEPGLYFGAWRPDVDCPERYANIGIRIEDDVLVTEDEPDVLTKRCPKTIADIEGIVGSL
ncbi:aminopeptidase P N-terminal domain-containing protein [Candidatus Poseidoniales archaeon]|nr:aminopeptidase P N-terminal domain-containing protein [Candidatus Poseidoniales archaeon]|tara:strand:- start:11580 stop:12947 length:1368 start_codon:yes stop_codon:yes gene_type:complete